MNWPLMNRLKTKRPVGEPTEGEAATAEIVSLCSVTPLCWNPPVYQMYWHSLHDFWHTDDTQQNILRRKYGMKHIQRSVCFCWVYESYRFQRPGSRAPKRRKSNFRNVEDKDTMELLQWVEFTTVLKKILDREEKTIYVHCAEHTLNLSQWCFDECNT